MHFPKFWAKGEWRGRDAAGNPITRDAWGWSDISEADARVRGEQRARALAEAWRPGGPPPARSAYGYPDRPLREPVLRTIASDGEAMAVVTRNSYGCEVLNTARAMFIDVDLPPPPTKRPGLFSTLFGGAKIPADAPSPVIEAKLALLQNWQRAHPDFAFRVYRTAGGLRYFLVSALLAPADPLAEEALARLDVDPNYQRLCRAQKTFRARLTPKHWRCGLRKPPDRFPFASAKQAGRFAAWLARYEAAAQQHAVCRHLRTIGGAPVASALAPILEEHDRATGVGSARPLA